MLRSFRVICSLALVLALAACSSTDLDGASLDARAVFPATVPLPDGFQPEGIAAGRGHTLFAGSLADGTIYAADLRSGAGEIRVPPHGGPTVGIAFDARGNRIFAAGGPTGMAYAFDATTGATVASWDVEGGFVNDVIVTKDAAYFTDSFLPTLYLVPFGPGGRLSADAEPLPLSGDYEQGDGFNLNGIEASADGSVLIVVQSATGTLFRVDPDSGVADAIELDGGAAVPGGDGLLLAGRTLYVVQNFLNQVAVVELAPGFGSGAVVEVLTDPALDIPTTAARFGNAVYAVNARFGTPPTPATGYDVVRLPR